MSYDTTIKNIQITAGNISFEAVLNDSKTAEAVWEALPIAANVSTWGDEIYFRIPVNFDLEKGQEVVEIGDLGYWPTGNAFCIFFGPTPVSRTREIRPASPVTVFGKIIGDTEILKGIASGIKISVHQKT
ncbi:cyclophilin-like fold protein [Chloroflexota bacterium]